MSVDQSMHHPRKRPFGISVIIFMLILYVLLLGTALFASFASDLPRGELAFWILKTDDPAAIHILFLAIILFDASIAAGLWRLQRFAWVLIMIHSGLAMASDLWGYFSGRPSYMTMLINVIIVLYLNQREVQMAFSGTQRGMGNG